MFRSLIGEFTPRSPNGEGFDGMAIKLYCCGCKLYYFVVLEYERRSHKGATIAWDAGRTIGIGARLPFRKDTNVCPYICEKWSVVLVLFWTE